MRLTTLVENSSGATTLGAEHGLSFYIEYRGCSILFDMGKGDLFLKNALALGCLVSAVELAVISHGHYDHGGGLQAFLKANATSPVYIKKSAFTAHRSHRTNGDLADIGLDPALLESGRFIFAGEREEIREGLTLFSGVSERELFSGCNADILKLEGGECVPDAFEHEQNLLLTEGDKTLLVAGCAHSGIVNILRRAEAILGRMPDVVVGGLHLENPVNHAAEPEKLIRAVGKVLAMSGAVFYTGHCTGERPFRVLKEMIGERLRPLHAGTVIEL